MNRCERVPGTVYVYSFLVHTHIRYHKPETCKYVHLCSFSVCVCEAVLSTHASVARAPMGGVREAYLAHRPELKREQMAGKTWVQDYESQPTG